MRWDIRHHLDGVITDDPKLFLEVRHGWHEGMKESFSLWLWLDVLRMSFFAMVFAIILRLRFGSFERQLIRPREIMNDNKQEGKSSR